MRRVALLAVAALLSLALAASSPTSQQSVPASDLSINTRVAILENRMDRMQTTLDELRNVPSQLARIEEQIRGLGKSGDSTAGIVQQVGMIVLAAAAGAGVRELAGRNKDK